MALEISHITPEVANNRLTIGSVSIEIELNKPIISYITTEQRTVIIDTVVLDDTIGHLDATFSISSAILRDSTGTESSLVLTFQDDSFVSDVVGTPFNVAPENMRLDFTFEGFVNGSAFTDVITDLVPTVLGI